MGFTNTGEDEFDFFGYIEKEFQQKPYGSTTSLAQLEKLSPLGLFVLYSHDLFSKMNINFPLQMRLFSILAKEADVETLPIESMYLFSGKFVIFIIFLSSY